MLRSQVIRWASFAAGNVAVITVLKIVSGDDHIHVGAPLTGMVAWFLVWLLLICDNKLP